VERKDVQTLSRKAVDLSKWQAINVNWGGLSGAWNDQLFLEDGC
jgi:hypothetical protein